MNNLKQTNYHSVQKKSVFSLCRKSTQKDNLLLTLPILRRNGIELERKANM